MSRNRHRLNNKMPTDHDIQELKNSRIISWITMHSLINETAELNLIQHDIIGCE